MCPSLSDSESELSLSGFETVASHSEEEEDEDEGSVMLSSPCSSPTSMLQEDHHGDREETQPNGITKHRSAELNKLNKGLVFSYRTVIIVFFLAVIYHRY